MEHSNPLTSLFISPSLLINSAEERSRPPNDKKYSLITTKTHPFLPLSIHNYTNKSAVLRQAWDNLGLAARSLVTKTNTGKVISRSLPKFFNFHEKWAYKPTGKEYAWRIEEKVDGSLISLFWYEDIKEWMVVSRSAFESASMHATSARRILEAKYPGILEKLDKEMTYVFELVDPRLPIKVKYKEEDLFLLAIVAKDGKEPDYGFDWTTLPFPRPRTHGHDHVASKKALNLKQLSKLNLDNEEGFVVLFWETAGDRYPKRIKVKFESYLESAGTAELDEAMSKISLSPYSSFSTNPIPPSNARILEIYTKQRLKIQHFKVASVSATMDRHKKNYLHSLEGIADDYGGAAWIGLVEKTWDRVDAIFSLQEAELREKIAALQKEGYNTKAISGNGNGNANEGAKEKFEKRLKKNDIDPAFRGALMSRFLREPVVRQVGHFVSNLEVPQDLRSEDVLKAL